MSTKNENKEKLNFALGRENYKLLGYRIRYYCYWLSADAGRQIRQTLINSVMIYSVSEE